jgi:uncharacterized membrane protein HdeD (DUF308 family)
MKNSKKGSTWDLQIVGMIAGIILIVCFEIMFWDAEMAPLFMTIVIGMGVIMNGSVAAIKLLKGKKTAGIFFTVIAAALLTLFFLRLFLLNG